MKAYTVYYIFKDDEENSSFIMDMDRHPTIEWLSALPNEKDKAVDCQEVSDDQGQDGVEFYFKTKKAATTFAKQFDIPISSISNKMEIDSDNPWLPEGCDSFEDCFEIYGDIPGNRG